METLQLLKTKRSDPEEMEILRLSNTQFSSLEEMLKSMEITCPTEENSQIPYNLEIYACQHCKHTCRGGCSCMLLG